MTPSIFLSQRALLGVLSVIGLKNDVFPSKGICSYSVIIYFISCNGKEWVDPLTLI